MDIPNVRFWPKADVEAVVLPVLDSLSGNERVDKASASFLARKQEMVATTVQAFSRTANAPVRQTVSGSEQRARSLLSERPSQTMQAAWHDASAIGT